MKEVGEENRREEKWKGEEERKDEERGKKRREEDSREKDGKKRMGEGNKDRSQIKDSGYLMSCHLKEKAREVYNGQNRRERSRAE